ncbi:MAG: universal stress protein [Bacteroidetes bacterium]|jgi:nucleotide-binding universal stress UspA family protein|nr:universal stress protein [Bacteroidota bacterium]
MSHLDSIYQVFVPTDFSEDSRNAMRTALDVISKHNASLTMAYVIEPIYNFASEVQKITEQLEQKANERFDEIISEAVKKGFEKDRLNGVVLHGKVTVSLLQEIERRDPDLVVMGSKGQTGLKKVIFGSVAETLMLRSNSPIAVIPKNVKNPSFSSVLFTTAFHQNEADNLKHLRSFLKPFDSDIRLIHVAPEPNFEIDIKVRGFTDILKSELMLEKKPRIDLVYSDKLLNGIVQYASENRMELIVINRYTKGLLESLFGLGRTHELIHIHEFPILVLTDN